MNRARHTIRFMLLFLVLLLVAPFFVTGPNGQPIMTWEKVKQRFFASLPATPVIPPTSLPTLGTGSNQTVYKWRDGKGIWHFTNDIPPAEAREVSVVQGTVNIMPTGKPAPTKQGETAKGETLPAIPGLPYSADTVKQVLDEAKKARQDANQYNKNLEQTVNTM